MNHRPPASFDAARLSGFCGRLTAVLLLAHLLAVMALAASPRLHHWVHPDADGDDHDCAVVLLLQGGGNAGPGPTIAPVPVEQVTVTLIVSSLPPAFVPSTFAANRVLEHAPPVAG